MRLQYSLPHPSIALYSARLCVTSAHLDQLTLGEVAVHALQPLAHLLQRDGPVPCANSQPHCDHENLFADNPKIPSWPAKCPDMECNPTYPTSLWLSQTTAEQVCQPACSTHRSCQRTGRVPASPGSAQCSGAWPPPRWLPARMHHMLAKIRCATSTLCGGEKHAGPEQGDSTALGTGKVAFVHQATTPAAPRG